MKDFYKILKVDPKASILDIKKAYRELAKKYHPDKNASLDAETRFKEVSIAYGVLSSPESRNQFDAFRLAGSLSQGSFEIENVEIISTDCRDCCTTGLTKIICNICKGNGHWHTKVEYGKSKVKSKIVCTTCKSTGIIFNECIMCLGTGAVKKFKTAGSSRAK